MGWLECMEREFFTDRLDERLIEFLGKQGILNGETDSDKWECLFKSAKEWRSEYMKTSEILAISSYFAWHINITLAEFSLPDNADTTEIMKKIFFAGWLLDTENDDYERECYKSSSLELEFDCAFEYPKEKCARLSKARLVEELKYIYDRSYDKLCRYKQCSDNNPKYIEWVEPSYPVLLSFIEQLQILEDPQAVRLNEFECDQYVWYIVRYGERIYFAQISDFA